MSNKTRSRLFEWLVLHYVSTFLLMIIFFVTFSFLSYDLFRIYSANTNYILESGIEGLKDGGLEQLVGLVGTTIVVVASYLGFKLCESALIHRATHRTDVEV